MTPDPHVHRTVSDTRLVRLQQHHLGIPVFQSLLTVTCSPSGEVLDCAGELLDLAGTELLPTLSGAAALMAGLTHLRAGTNDASPCEIHHPELLRFRRTPRLAPVAGFPLPHRPTVFATGPFDRPPTAELSILPSHPPRLCWLLRLTVNGDDVQLLIDAERKAAERLLYCSYADRSATCRGPVYFFSPGDGSPRPGVFPRPPAQYPASLQAQKFAGHLQAWIESNATKGNNVETWWGSQRRYFKATTTPNGLVFVPPDPLGREQMFVNAFYLCNWLHDLFLFLGFGEAEGNFQLQHFSTAPGGGDRLRLKLYPGPVTGGGKMLAQRDGFPAELRLGTWPGTGNPAALDADIVIHEFVHGVTQRLVGGRLGWSSLQAPQSVAMGEGWSDYFAITFQNYYRNNPRFTLGSWVSGRKDGIRSARYDANFAGNYGRLTRVPPVDPHHAGEVWAAALIRVNVYLGALLQSPASGHELGWVLVIEGLKQLKTGNPSFLQGRDALLLAIGELERAGRINAQIVGGAVRAVWQAFAELGMGRDAVSTGSGYPTGITPNFSI